MKSKPRKSKRRKPSPTAAAIEFNRIGPPLDRSSPQWSVWSPWKRRIASVLIFAFLFLLITGPLSNPVGSPHLSIPIAETLAPLHRGLFMGHGYRFFAPNPGDSHLVQYKITRQDGTQIKGMFPDRNSAWPRLLYHRWFMLSETIFAEHAQTPSRNEFRKLDTEKRKRVELLSKGGKLELANRLEKQRAQEEVDYQKTMRRIETLVRATGEFLLTRHNGQEIELSVVTRTIPYPAEIRQGANLDDEVFLRYPTSAVIGRFTKADFSDATDKTGNGEGSESIE